MGGVSDRVIGMLMAIVMLAAVLAVSHLGSSASPAAASLDAESFQRFLARAIQTGGQDGDGATIAVSVTSKGPLAQLYEHRPYGASPAFNGVPIDQLQMQKNVTVKIAGYGPPYAIFVDPDGRVELALWQPSQGTIATPGCPGPGTLPMTFTAGGAVNTTVTKTLTIGCDGTLQ